MSFRCDQCKESSGVYETPVRVVLETRQVLKPDPYKDQMRSEIVRETSVCGACAFKLRPNNEGVMQVALRNVRTRKMREMKPDESSDQT